MRNKSNLRKRFSSLLLILIIVIAMIPTSIWAEEGEEMKTQAVSEAEFESENKISTESESETESMSESESSSQTESESSASIETAQSEESVTKAQSNTVSISGMLWYDKNSDGVCDNGEEGIASYPVYLYKEGDTENAVQTVTTDTDGKYEFTDIEPGIYVVGVKSNELGTDYYLLPVVGVTGDNKLGTWSDERDEKYSDAVTMDKNSTVTDMDCGLRTPPGKEPMAYYTINMSTVSSAGTGYTYANNVVTFTTTANSHSYYITGSTSEKTLYIPSGVSTTLILNGVTMQTPTSPIRVSVGTANITLASSTINTLTCTSTTYTGNAAGIYNDSGIVNISGSGTLNATGSSNGGTYGGAGIGVSVGTITISSGTVIAKGGDASQGGVGIGDILGGRSTITISGGTVTATGGSGAYSGAGLGGGYVSTGGTIKISGGTVTATSGLGNSCSGAGIGGGSGASGGTISISGGTVTATANNGGSGGNGAGIGGGGTGNVSGTSGGVITISGGTVTATGGADIWAGTQGGAGIGGGGHSSNGGGGGSITISGGTVTATGKSTGTCDIGYGYKGSGGTTVITGGSVYPTRGASYVYNPTNGSINGNDTLSMTLNTSYKLTAFSLTVTGSLRTYTYSGTGHAAGAYVWAPSAPNYIITYNANGGSGSMSSTIFTYGTNFALRTNTFTRTGFTFLGWSTSSSATSATYTDGVTVSGTAFSANTTLYAVWKVNTYTITYNSNGGSGSMSSTSFTYGTNFALRTNTFTRAGYTFLGWSTSSSATSATYTDGVTVSGTAFSANTTLYAVWQAIPYTITYNSNGGSGSMSGTSFTYGTSFILSTNTFTRTGYTFLGWSTSSSATSATHTDGATVSGTAYSANTTLYAVWQANTYTITYNSNGGSGSMSSTIFTYGTSFSLSTNTFTRAGYSLLGWSTNSGATSATYTDGETLSGTEFSANTILYAVWLENIITEKYVDTNGNPISGISDTSITFTATPYNYAFTGSTADITTTGGYYRYIGYKFDSYSAGDTLDGTSPSIPTATINAGRTVYLVYENFNTLINVTVPSSFYWYADGTTETSPGSNVYNIKSGNYSIINNSADLNLKVEIDSYAYNAYGTTFSTVNTSDITLNLTGDLSESPIGIDLLNGTSQYGTYTKLLYGTNHMTGTPASGDKGTWTFGFDGTYTGSLPSLSEVADYTATLTFSVDSTTP